MIMVTRSISLIEVMILGTSKDMVEPSRWNSRGFSIEAAIVQWTLMLTMQYLVSNNPFIMRNLSWRHVSY